MNHDRTVIMVVSIYSRPGDSDRASLSLSVPATTK